MPIPVPLESSPRRIRCSRVAAFSPLPPLTCRPALVRMSYPHTASNQVSNDLRTAAQYTEGTKRAAIVEAGEATAREIDAAIDALSAWSRLPDAAYWFARCWAEGTRPT